MATCELDLGSAQRAAEFAGALDQNLQLIEREFVVELIGRGQMLTVVGEQENVKLAVEAARQMLEILRCGGNLDERTARYCVNMVKAGEKEAIAALEEECILVTAKGKPIKPKTVGQKKYLAAIRDNSIVFGIGPAGTGKTYLSVVMAVSALKNHEVSRLILTRPAVEAGEKLGFLPGDLQTKIDPYLRPLYDALFDTMGPEGFQKQLERGVIEVAPLAYMRGRTLDNAFIILDEAQNTTGEQMKMFLTRLGTGSKMVINGDVTQIDLPDGKKSGLIEATKLLEGIEGIHIHRFSARDIVRNRLVTAIVQAYEKNTKKPTKPTGKKGR